MKPRPVDFLRIPLALAALFAGLQPAAAVAQSFTIVATNIIMPTNGTAGVSQVTLTSVGGYTGTIYVGCQYSGLTTSANLPICSGYTMPNDFQLAANQTLTTGRVFYPYGVPIPLHLPAPPPGKVRAPLAAMALPGMVLLGLGLRRKSARWLAMLLLGTLALAGIAACAGSSSMATTTPGTYTYSITGTDISTNVTVSTTILVTVP